MDFSNVLMPINYKFIEVFKDFMNDDLKNKARANNIRQYAEGIIDFVLFDKIEKYLTESSNIQNTEYKNLNWSKKLNILDKVYDKDIVSRLRKIFEVGANGSHFNGEVNDEELKSIIEYVIHIVEDIFVSYFKSDEHKFGSENIYTIFSMLPLKHRIYILERLVEDIENENIAMVIDKLSLAYVKNDEINKANKLLDKTYLSGMIDKNCFDFLKIRNQKMNNNIHRVHEINSHENFEQVNAIVDDAFIVLGYPSAKNIIDSKNIMKHFSVWFESDKEKYPDFINMFYYLMLVDNRKYI